MNATEFGAVQIIRCDPMAEPDVLALAAHAWPEAERTSYAQAIAAAMRSGQADQIVLVAAKENEEFLAAQLAQVLPGRVGVVWQPQIRAADATRHDALAVMLFSRLVRELVSSGAHLAQAVLSPTDQVAAKRFTLGGFTPAADLLYLAADVGNATTRPALSFEFESFTPQAESRLIELLDRTYIGTLDCPRIDGLRKTADVVAGYKSVGEFRPELWQIVRQDGADIGCLLINVHPDVKHGELVYMGLVPEVRGRGWGLLLAEHALWLARQANCDRVVLAVDAANQPAIRQYFLAGFSQFDVRAVWIRPLS
jgi:mycothiol synthase